MPTSGDAGSTATFLHAANAFAQAQAANLDASVAAMEREASGMATGCPSVMLGAPKSAQFSALAAEVVSAVLFSSIAPDRSASLAFAARISALRWRNQALARLVRALAEEERAAVKLVLPNVCADMVAWKTSGYRTLSPSTAGFLKATEAIGRETKGAGGEDESLEEAVLARLRPYETRGERQLAKRAKRVDGAGGKRLLSAYTKALSPLGKTLGLEPS